MKKGGKEGKGGEGKKKRIKEKKKKRKKEERRGEERRRSQHPVVPTVSSVCVNLSSRQERPFPILELTKACWTCLPPLGA